MEDERSIHLNKRTDKTYVSSRITDRAGTAIRIASKVFESSESVRYALEKGELVIRVGERNRQEIKAKFLEDDRGVFILTFQEWNSETGKPYEKTHFSFRGGEIPRIVAFLNNIAAVDLTGAEKVNITDEQLRQTLLSNEQVRKLVADNEELFAIAAEQEISARDIVALKYRKVELDRFKQLLNDVSAFDAERERVGSAEKVWQQFFERNQWIFGYGLCHLFLTGLDNRKLEQVVRGFDLGGEGKRADAVMKTRALINSFCFVEIKTHRTPLLSDQQYRSGVWAPSPELAGGVAQAQTTAQVAIERLQGRIDIADQSGDPTGEALFNFEPRSFVVAGSLSEFRVRDGINLPKFRSFELFRRNTRRPEILTFDELFERARFIVETT